MSGAIIFRMGGPTAWTAIQQDKTSLSSCGAEIRATNEGCKITIATRNLAKGSMVTGNPLSDDSSPTTVYNGNEACINWAIIVTMKEHLVYGTL